MVSDWEIWAAANEVVRQHGDDALVFAACRQIELGEQGDREGCYTWLQILKKIAELRREPAPGEPIQ